MTKEAVGGSSPSAPTPRVARRPPTVPLPDTVGCRFVTRTWPSVQFAAVRVRPEGYETTREYRHRKVRDVRAAKQRNHDWGFAVLEALGRALYEAGNPGCQPVELMRPCLLRSRGFGVVGVSAGWPIAAFTPEDGTRPKTCHAAGRRAVGRRWLGP